MNGLAGPVQRLNGEALHPTAARTLIGEHKRAAALQRGDPAREVGPSPAPRV